MADQDQDANIITSILSELNTTPYACTSLTRLSGGTANFVYRGALHRPLEDGTTTVILKHAEEFLAGWRDFRLMADRCLIEARALDALQTLPRNIQPTKENGKKDSTNLTIQIKTPHLYHFSPQTHTQVQEDLPAAQDLKTYLTTTTGTEEPESLSPSLAGSIGRALGQWLLSFHAWIEDPVQRDLKTQMGQNRLMQELKCSVNYDNLVKTVERFPGALGEFRDVFERVRDMARNEIGRCEGIGVGGIHGDFWTGNILLQNNLHRQQNTTATIFITDWELTQCGPRALDLGQMIAELYMTKLYKGIDAGIWILRSFVEGYRPALNEDIAFRAVIHAGVHLVAFGTMVTGWGNEEQVEKVARVGRDLVVKGWEKDRGWFVEESVLGCLFE